MLKFIIFTLLITFSIASLSSTTTSVSNGRMNIPSALLGWDKNNFAKRYHLQISSDIDFEKIIFQYKTKKNSYKYMLKRPGTLYWHVRYYDKRRKKYSEFSEAGVINVTFDNPYTTSNEFIYAKKNIKPFFQLSWEVQRRLENGFYILETSISKKFSHPKTYQLKKNSKKIKATPTKNILYWKVAKSSAVSTQKLNFSPIYKQIVFFEEIKENPTMDLFYSYSKGNYLEQEQGLVIKNVQNSPLTMGFNLKYHFLKFKRLSLSSSFYISSFESLHDETSEKEVFIPPEIGLTSYLNYNFKKYNFDLYLGADYEAISGYNINTIFIDKALGIVPHQLVYITTGLFKLFKIKKHHFFFKISYSLSIIDKTSFQSYSGSKYLIYFNYKIFEKLSFHTFYKLHSLHAVSDLAIDRIGMGINFKVW